MTHQAPYHHFASREAILVTLAQHGFELLYAALAAARAAATTPEAQFRDCGVAYFRFALEHRAHFQMMFRPESHAGQPPELRAAAFRALSVLVEVVMSAKRVPPADAMSLVLTAWSTAHGAASLWVDGALSRVAPMYGSDPMNIAAKISETLTRFVFA